MSTDPKFVCYEEPPEMDFSDEVSPEARRQRRWRQRNYESYILRNRVETARYRAKRLGASGDFTVAEWLMLAARYGFRCLCCGQMGGGNDLQIDHVVPLEKGGSNSIDNLQPLCEMCNKAKYTKTIDYRNMANLRNALAQADAVDWREGKLSYFRYRRLMRRIGEFYGFTLQQTTAGFCCLSPNNDFMGNLRSLASLLKGLQEGVEPSRIVVSTYRACLHRAIPFINGVEDFENHYANRKTGKKILNFYRNIINPLDSDAVTIDGHAYSIWMGQRMTMKEAVRSKFSYDAVADGYRKLASENGLLPSQAQGILWFTWKRLHHVIFRPQLSLFNPTDQWGLLIRPEAIKPFPFREAGDDQDRSSNRAIQ